MKISSNAGDLIALMDAWWNGEKATYFLLKKKEHREIYNEPLN